MRGLSLERELPLNILEFIRHPELLNDQCHSHVQLVCLKSTYGLPLSQTELGIYQRGTNRERYDATEQREVTFVAGRRSGKTSKIAAPIVCFEAFRDHGIPPGEEAYAMLLAPTIAQARIAFRSIKNYLRRSRILSKRVVRITKDEIKLDNGIVIGCYACNYDGVRGRTIVAAVCDELAFWPDGEDTANSAEEVITALLPGMATVHNAKLVKISTPFGKSGLLWREFQQRAELEFPVWQLTTQEMNPTISLSMLERERRRSEEKYRREFLAEFTDTLSDWLVPEILDPCVARGRRELPSLPDVIYAAALDPATRHNDFALAILHLSSDETIILDRLDRWTGTKTTPLAFESVLRDVKRILDMYGINRVIGDQFYCDVINQHLLKIGIFYEVCVFGAQTRTKLFANLKHLLVQGKIELLDEPEFLRQLRNLREEKTARGQIDVRPGGGMRDDFAVAVALAASELTKRPSLLAPPQLGIVELYTHSFPVMIPGSCRVEAVCRNFPCCLDAGSCKGFADERVSR
jgi:terminase large subunit-like protein